MVDWQVTAITINCSVVEEEVTVIVKNDWSVKCTGFEKLSASRSGLCNGSQCQQVTQYTQKLKAEETKKAGHSGDHK